MFMMERILLHYDSINTVLIKNHKKGLVIGIDEKFQMEAIVELLTPLKQCGEALSSEKDVTISFIVPHFKKLRDHLSENDNDLPLIKHMKSKC